MSVYGIWGEEYKKYGYTEQRYYQLLKAFSFGWGNVLLLTRKRCENHEDRKDDTTRLSLIVFLDHKMSAAVIAQKLNQIGISISQRSVERTIQEYGTSKKLYQLKSHKGD